VDPRGRFRSAFTWSHVPAVTVRQQLDEAVQRQPVRPRRFGSQGCNASMPDMATNAFMP